MMFRLLADSALIAHLVFIVWAVFGGLSVLRFPKAVLIHLPAVCWAVYIEWSGGLCPLTVLEVELRHRAGNAGYAGSFIEHYLLPVIYPAGLTRSIQYWLAGLVLLINVAVYGSVIYRYRISRLGRTQQRRE